MAKITYANKQTAVDPENPAANEIYFATDANEVKASVNALYDIIANLQLVDGFVSGPSLVATSATSVAIETFTQNVSLVYNANGFQYTVAAGVADQSFTGTPDLTLSKGCIIQANGTIISLKEGVASASIIYPTPDTGYVTIYSFILTTTGITDISAQLAAYAKMNEINTGNMNITGAYMINGVALPIPLYRLSYEFTGGDVVDGAIDLSLEAGMPVAGTFESGLRVHIDGLDNSQSASYDPVTQIVFAGFTGSETLITIIITF